MKGQYDKQVTVRLSEDYLKIINSYDGDSFTQKFKSLIDDFKKKGLQVEKNINERQKELKKVEGEIGKKRELLKKLESIENYINWAVRYCEKDE